MTGKNYNVYRYLLSIRGEKQMTFESIFGLLHAKYQVPLTDDKDPSISLITEEPFYIKPVFEDIKLKRDARILVISAPGATGKSALAKYLAHHFSSIYWNLAEITLGDNSFVGTLVRSLGTDNFSSFTQKLHSGETLLVVDAFDEAEMISGPKAVRAFLTDIGRDSLKATAPCAILLSRAETAQSMCAVFEEENIPFNHYEIAFFEEQASFDFIEQVAQRTPSDSTNQPQVIRECISQYIQNIKNLVDDEQAHSFIGYAPVLEVIGMHIAKESNAYSFLMSLQREEGLQGIDVVSLIMQKLMERESKKVIEAFKRRIAGKTSDTIDETALYGAKEQMLLLLNYMIFSSIDEDTCTNSNVPDDVYNEYLDVVNTFLPQHPFIRKTTLSGTEFAGPAFRDYVLAELMKDESCDELVHLYCVERRISFHFPSHLLWLFYTRGNAETVCITSDKIPYLFESYKSQSRKACQAYLEIGGDKDLGYSTVWSLSSPRAGDIDESESYDLVVRPYGLTFENLTNTFVDVDCPVIVKNEGRNVRISKSTVTAKQIHIVTDQLIFDAYDNMECLLVSKDNAVIESSSHAPTDIIINGTNVNIDFPNLRNFHKLIKYGYTFSEENEFSLDQFIYLLRKIFVQFRKHRKDTPARDLEKINFVIIGKGKARKEVFDFLCAEGVIYPDAYVYKIDMAKLAAVGISWGAVTMGDASQLQKVYHSFIDWKNANTMVK